MIITKDTPGLVRAKDKGEANHTYLWEKDLIVDEDLTIALDSYLYIKGDLKVNGSITVDSSLEVAGYVKVMEFANFSYDLSVEESIFVGEEMQCSDVFAEGSITCGKSILSTGYIRANGNIVVGEVLVACGCECEDTGSVLAGGQIVLTTKRPE